MIDHHQDLCAPAPRSRGRSADRAFIAGMFLLFALSTVAAFTACGARAPATRYYDLVPPMARGGGGGPVIALEPLSTDDAYDDERIVYRSSRYRLDYYDYHRWSAPPGVMIGNYLERSLERSGRFGGVVREVTRDTGALLTGRVVAIEEVDVSKQAWEGHLVLELRLVDARTGDTLWSEQFEESEPLAAQTPEGLAEAISTAMGRIVDRAAPAIEAHASAGRVDAETASLAR